MYCTEIFSLTIPNWMKKMVTESKQITWEEFHGELYPNDRDHHIMFYKDQPESKLQNQNKIWGINYKWGYHKEMWWICWAITKYRYGQQKTNKGFHNRDN